MALKWSLDQRELKYVFTYLILFAYEDLQIGSPLSYKNLGLESPDHIQGDPIDRIYKKGHLRNF